MAQAKKCDICGALYEFYTVSYGKTGINGIGLSRISEDNRFTKIKVLDCCPTCMDTVMNVLNEKRKVAKE